LDAALSLAFHGVGREENDTGSLSDRGSLEVMRENPARRLAKPETMKGTHPHLSNFNRR
jgi:hypothetical protein